MLLLSELSFVQRKLIAPKVRKNYCILLISFGPEALYCFFPSFVSISFAFAFRGSGPEALLLLFPFCHIILVTFFGKKVTKKPSGEEVSPRFPFLRDSAKQNKLCFALAT